MMICWLIRPVVVLAVVALATVTHAEAPPAATVTRDVAYRPAESLSTAADRALCVVDLHVPQGRPTIATLVWFHGGGLVGGEKKEADALAVALNAQGIAVASANYRLSPAAHFPVYVQDAAAVVAWTIRHAADFGGSARSVFVGGYSAGGFLAASVGTDARWLKAEGFAPSDLRGIVAISPQVFTHYAIRAERGVTDPERTPVIDDAAPVFNASAATPPLRLFVGDHDMPTRLEELQCFMAVLRAKQHPDATLTLIPDRTHGSMHGNAAQTGDPVGSGIIEFIQSHRSAPSATKPADK